jgi:DNA (cytosine-5)-methyltransferase 1
MTSRAMDVDCKTGSVAGSHSVHRLVGHSFWRHLDLFSGIGGFALACRMVGGIETVGFCEREPYAQRVLKKHWPDVPICNDIHEMKGNEYGPIDIITGGFPCQPYSVAGERRGNEDDRALWPQMLRVIREARPTWVLGENVPGIITLALDGVLADLEAQGYACETLCIPACGVDARHRRERIWIVAHATGSRINGKSRDICEAQWGSGGALCGKSVGSSENVGNSESNGWRKGEPNARRGNERTCAREKPGSRNNDCALADSNTIGLSKSQYESGKEWTSGAGQWPRSAGSRGWATEPAVGRVANGIPSRVDRLRGLGNAIVPQVAAEIIAAMKRVDYLANIAIDNPNSTGKCVS